jgi:soluble lytic murein transglycosylase-like protein
MKVDNVGLIDGIKKPSRRKAIFRISSGLSLLLIGEQTIAGNQLEEPMIDAVRTALSSAVNNHAPPIPEFATTDSRIRHLRWLAEASHRLQKRMPSLPARQEFLQTLWYEAQRAGLDVQLVLGLVQVESNFRKHAVSVAGACGFMQVMPFWMKAIGDGDTTKLFHMQTNLRFGCVILRHYLDREKGDLYMALGRYNGSRGKPDYPNAVFAAQKHWDIDVQ